MQLSKIEFNGYKRLHKASCNVDGQTIAFIGPNEAGKSSVLRGLAWLTDDAPESALPLREQNRQQPPSDDVPVVRAHYRLDADDIDHLRTLPIDPDRVLSASTITAFRLSRKKSGQQTTGLDTTVGRNPRPFSLARTAAAACKARVESSSSEFAVLEFDPPTEALADAIEALDASDMDWSSDRVQRVRSVATELEEIGAAIEAAGLKSRAATALRKSVENVVSLFSDAVRAGALEDPQRAMRIALAQRVPKFLLFGDNDRDLAEAYDLGDDALRASPPAPLRNITAVAGTTVEELWNSTRGGDTARMRTLERRVDKTLLRKLQPMWTQSRLTVELTLNQDGLLEINILELDSPDEVVTPIAERSDGLRTFLGLVCFLIAASPSAPPVLLVDEAERNLHYDAQADLIRVLTRELEVHKVIYTTHSPGCLPMDLETGIRIVSRDTRDPGKSRLENNFWTNEEPGFSRLLFAMGAEAAAFSAFRRAVLAEGVSEMILLPTLLRNATDGSQLDFQVAFGLSNLSVPRAMSSVALITTFLVDGDGSGTTKRKQLEKAGVPAGHIFQLPKNKAIEDLIDRTVYLTAVNKLLAESGRHIPENTEFASDMTIARAVDDYARTHLGLTDGVGHKIVASRLAQLGADLTLSREGRNFLPKLRRNLEDAFTSTYHLTPPSEDD